MRRGGRILVVLGLLLGALTAAGTFIVISTAETAPPIQTKPVVVALQPITNLSIIAADAVGIKEWPVTALPPSGVLEKTDAVVGMLAIQNIYPGQIILQPMIVNPKQAGEIAARSKASFVIPEGKVGMAFSINDVTGVAGALQPGDYVDVLLTLSPSILPTQTVRAGTQPVLTGNEGLPVTQLMLQDILILQVGNWTAAGQEKTAGNVLTLAVDRQDALALKSAREQGQIDLVLRRVADHKVVDAPEPVTVQYLNRRFKFNLTPLPR